MDLGDEETIKCYSQNNESNLFRNVDSMVTVSHDEIVENKCLSSLSTAVSNNSEDLLLTNYISNEPCMDISDQQYTDPDVLMEQNLSTQPRIFNCEQLTECSPIENKLQDKESFSVTEKEPEFDMFCETFSESLKETARSEPMDILYNLYFDESAGNSELTSYATSCMANSESSSNFVCDAISSEIVESVSPFQNTLGDSCDGLGNKLFVIENRLRDAEDNVKNYINDSNEIFFLGSVQPNLVPNSTQNNYMNAEVTLYPVINNITLENSKNSPCKGFENLVQYDFRELSNNDECANTMRLPEPPTDCNHNDLNNNSNSRNFLASCVSPCPLGDENTHDHHQSENMNVFCNVLNQENRQELEILPCSNLETSDNCDNQFFQITSENLIMQENIVDQSMLKDVSRNSMKYQQNVKKLESGNSCSFEMNIKNHLTLPKLEEKQEIPLHLALNDCVVTDFTAFTISQQNGKMPSDSVLKCNQYENGNALLFPYQSHLLDSENAEKIVTQQNVTKQNMYNNQNACFSNLELNYYLHEKSGEHLNTSSTQKTTDFATSKRINDNHMIFPKEFKPENRIQCLRHDQIDVGADEITFLNSVSAGDGNSLKLANFPQETCFINPKHSCAPSLNLQDKFYCKSLYLESLSSNSESKFHIVSKQYSEPYERQCNTSQSKNSELYFLDPDLQQTSLLVTQTQECLHQLLDKIIRQQNLEFHENAIYSQLKQSESEDKFMWDSKEPLAANSLNTSSQSSVNDFKENCLNPPCEPTYIESEIKSFYEDSPTPHSCDSYLEDNLIFGGKQKSEDAGRLLEEVNVITYDRCVQLDEKEKAVTISKSPTKLWSTGNEDTFEHRMDDISLQGCSQSFNSKLHCLDTVNNKTESENFITVADNTSSCPKNNFQTDFNKTAYPEKKFITPCEDVMFGPKRFWETREVNHEHISSSLQRVEVSPIKDESHFIIKNAITKSTLEAVKSLNKGQGASVIEILRYVRQHAESKRNFKLCHDVRMFLRDASEIGILNIKSGKYMVRRNSINSKSSFPKKCDSYKPQRNKIRSKNVRLKSMIALQMKSLITNRKK